jgi:hypothetical protein
MNIPLDNRLNDAISRIENRERNRLPIPRSNIPKTPQYYDQKAKEALDLNEPYLRSVYLRCAKLAREGGKSREITRLLYIANQTIERKRNPAPVSKPVSKKPVRKTKSKYNLRSSKTIAPHQELYHDKNLNEFVVDYTQKVKHKKQNLFKFLEQMYEQDRKYVPSSYKFAKVKRSTRSRMRA